MLRVLDEDVACIPIRDPDRTESGLWVPEKAKQRVDQGIVKYVGPNVTTVRRGDHVIFGGYGGNKLTVEGEGELILVPESGIVAIYDDHSERFVTESEILRFLEVVEGELHHEDRGFDREMVSLVAEKLSSKIGDFISAEGFEF